jgi:hypothetical protein
VNSEPEPTSNLESAPDATPEEAVLRGYTAPVETEAACRRVKPRVLREFGGRPRRFRLLPAAGVGLAATIVVGITLWLTWPAPRAYDAPLAGVAALSSDRTTFPELEALGTQVASIRTNLNRLKSAEFWNHSNSRPDQDLSGGTQQ